ncbi:hypothetical protein [Xylanimonas allomyrinae]|uniref:hypothetical protein n=1 Tax=Xylanimonas allomyrinae TaxID=2509459 RepID=UPI0013A65FA6|nr:hypothetical protein [Xylanimonas allomyrinae]
MYDLEDDGSWAVVGTIIDGATVGTWTYTAHCIDYAGATGAPASGGWTTLAKLSGAMEDTSLLITGQETAVTAGGFAPGESIEVYLDGERFATDTADADGTISGTFATGNGSTLGAHTLRLVGVSTKGAVELPFTVVSATAAPVPAAPAPPTFVPTAPAKSPSGAGVLPSAANDVVL